MVLALADMGLMSLFVTLSSVPPLGWKLPEDQGALPGSPFYQKNQSVISKHMIQEYVQDLRGP